MTERIQSLMEELGPGTGVVSKVVDGQRIFMAYGPGFSRPFTHGDTPIEALTKLRDKVKPRTPEQVVKDVLRRRFSIWNHLDVDAVVSALRDAGMLREGA